MNNLQPFGLILVALFRICSCTSVYLNPLTPGAFSKKYIFWTFWWFLGWISAKLALI